MTEIGRCLARLVAHHKSLRVYQSEGINHDFAFDRLYGINDDSNGARCELLERLLGIDVH